MIIFILLFMLRDEQRSRCIPLYKHYGMDDTTEVSSCETHKNHAIMEKKDSIREQNLK